MGEIAKSDLVVFAPENLRQYTNEFSEDNFIGDTHFGKLYRGTILHGSDPSAARHVTVKIWEDPPPRDPVMWQFEPGDNKLRLEVCCSFKFFSPFSLSWLSAGNNMIALLG